MSAACEIQSPVRSGRVWPSAAPAQARSTRIERRSALGIGERLTHGGLTAPRQAVKARYGYKTGSNH